MKTRGMLFQDKADLIQPETTPAVTSEMYSETIQPHRYETTKGHFTVGVVWKQWKQTASTFPCLENKSNNPFFSCVT